MVKRPTIWLTRPLEDSTSFANELAAQNIGTIIAPVLAIMRQPLPALTLTSPAALLITSRHAAHALAALPKEWLQLPAYCVGGATAQAVEHHGLTRIVAGTRNALALIPTIIADIPAGSELLYLAGDETRTDVVAQLTAENIHVTTAIVYRAVAERTLSDEIMSALSDQRVSAVAFFSARSAEIACTMMKRHGLNSTANRISAYCLSANVAAAAKAMPWAGIHTCHIPTRHAMRELIVSRERKKG
jgi:uroporphyrinogen-III synthase